MKNREIKEALSKLAEGINQNAQAIHQIQQVLQALLDKARGNGKADNPKGTGGTPPGTPGG